MFSQILTVWMLLRQGKGLRSDHDEFPLRARGEKHFQHCTEPLINTVTCRLRLGGLSLTGPKNCNAVTLGQSSQSPLHPHPHSLTIDYFYSLLPSFSISSEALALAAWCCSHSCHNLIIDPRMECCTGPHESLRSNQPFRSMHIFVHSREEEKTAQITCWLP